VNEKFSRRWSVMKSQLCEERVKGKTKTRTWRCGLELWTVKQCHTEILEAFVDLKSSERYLHLGRMEHFDEVLERMEDDVCDFVEK